MTMGMKHPLVRSRPKRISSPFAVPFLFDPFNVGQG